MGGDRALTKALDALQDVIGRLGPDERLGILIADLDIASDIAFQLDDALVRGSLDLPLREQREPSLDLVEPGAVRRREVEVEAGVLREPSLDRWCLVSRIVVHHDVDVELLGNLLVEAA